MKRLERKIIEENWQGWYFLGRAEVQTKEHLRASSVSVSEESDSKKMDIYLGSRKLEKGHLTLDIMSGISRKIKYSFLG